MRRTTKAHAVITAALFTAAAVLPAVAVMAQQEQAVEEALLGFDPIELIGGNEVLGDSDITAQYNGLEYLFVSVANRDLFNSDPQRYGIQMGNLCARLGRTTGGDQDLYTVYDGRIYIFASDECVRIFEAAPEEFLDPPTPPSLRDTASAEELQRGDELVDLMLQAMGGAEAIDGLQSFVERYAVKRPGPDGLVDAERTAILDMAHQRMRREQSIPGGVFAQVWSQDGGWWQRAALTGVYSPAQAENFGKEMVIANPLYILRMRNHDLFVAAARGRGNAGMVEQVDVELGDYRWTLGIEPNTGLPASLTYVDRGPEGNWGELTYLLSDYRAIDGITWPHERVVTFDGEALPWWNARTLEAHVNDALDGVSWSRPEHGGSD